jgi:hypothetical protein
MKKQKKQKPNYTTDKYGSLSDNDKAIIKQLVEMLKKHFEENK